MSGTLRLRGATSGYSELQAPAVAADQTFILPTAGGTLITTDSPIPKLTLELGSASQPSLTFEGDTDTGLYSSGTNTLNLVTGGNNRLNIDSGGKVGINTTSPTKTLDVNGTFRVVDESTFDDDVTIYGDAQLNQQGIKLQNGLITAVTNSSQNSVFRGNTTAGGDNTIDLSGGGRASFAGDVYIGARWGGLAPSTTPPITLAATGAATFASTGKFGSTVIAKGSTSGANVFLGLQESPSGSFDPANANVIITADGSASFAGGQFALNADGEITTNVKSAGHIELDSTGAFSSPKIKLFANTGNATFTGNVGIGTSTISRKFVVSGGSSEAVAQFTNATSGVGADDGFQIIHFNNGYTQLLNRENESLSFGTNNTERMRIDSSGRVAIGTSSPLSGSKLTIAGNGLAITGQNGDHSANSIRIGEEGSGLAQIRCYGPDTSTNGSLTLRTCRSNGLNNLDITFDSSGKVGIGTSSPSYKLDVENTDNATYTAGNFIINASARIHNSSTTTNSFASLAFRTASGDNAIGFQYTGTANQADFVIVADGGTNGVERLRIDSSGMVRTFASTANGGLNVFTSQAASTGANLILGQHSATSTTSGTLSFIVFSNGDVRNTNNAYGSISDQKLKENIVDAKSQWDDLKAIQVRNYNFIEGQTHTQIGVVAQEVELVSPGLVTESPDRDEDDNDLGTVTKSVNYSVLYMKAVKALQEAMDRIETLEAKVAALEAG